MKLWELEATLQRVKVFDDPKIIYEQYPTSAHLASRILHTALNDDNIEDKLVVDLGCGTGMLSIGAAALGATVMGIDIDSDAIEIAQMNAKQAELDIEFIQANLEDVQFKICSHTVIMNPPFGTKTSKGIDAHFLETACNIATDAVYSLHKSSTREYIVKKAAQLGWNCDVVAQLRFDIPQMYKFHKSASVDVQVDLVRLTKSDGSIRIPKEIPPPIPHNTSRQKRPQRGKRR